MVNTRKKNFVIAEKEIRVYICILNFDKSIIAISCNILGKLEQLRKSSYCTHYISLNALLMRSHCSQCVPERIMSVSAFISRSMCSYCSTMALILRSYSAHIAL